MKIIKKIYIIIAFAIFMLLFFSVKSYANTIKKIDMDIYLDKNGNASIKEVWSVNLSTGTEGYRPYSNMYPSEISNFKVVDNTGKVFEVVDKWDTSKTFKEKAYKCGISGDGELCWGISDYKITGYTLTYDISNFVNQYTDVQGIYFKLLNLDQPVGNANISIHTDVPLSLDNARIWCFGNKGEINFKDGKIFFSSNGKVSSSQYVTVLIRFQENLFDISIRNPNSFDYYYDSAMEGVEREKKLNSFSRSFMLYIMFIMLFPAYVLWEVFHTIFRSIRRSKSGVYDSNELNLGLNGKGLPKDKKVDYYREIPCQKNMAKAYWILYKYGIVEVKNLKKGVVGALILKWVRDNRISVEEGKAKLLKPNENNYVINLADVKIKNGDVEDELLQRLKLAAGVDGVLTPRELKKYCKKNYIYIRSWYDKLLTEGEKLLIQEGLLEKEEIEYVQGTIFKTKYTREKKTARQELVQEALRLKGLKKFLLDFSNMPEREYIEVNVWEEYLIFAELLGIANKVRKQLNNLYPQFNEQSRINLNYTTSVTQEFSTYTFIGMTKGINAARRSIRYSSSYSGSDRSSGGGGSSYSGGGSSAGGSSGGGFR